MRVTDTQKEKEKTQIFEKSIASTLHPESKKIGRVYSYKSIL